MSFYRGAIIYNLPVYIIQSALACLQLGSSAPQKVPFSFGNGYQKYISILEQWIIPIVDWEFLSPCIYFCCTCVIVLVPWWMSPHPLPLLWCGLSLSLIIAPSYPVSTFWCFLCALPDRISNKKSLSFWFLAEWAEWPLAFSLDYLVGRKTNWGGNMWKVWWVCRLTALFWTCIMLAANTHQFSSVQFLSSFVSLFWGWWWWFGFQTFGVTVCPSLVLNVRLCKVNNMLAVGHLKLVCWKIVHYRATFISWIYYAITLIQR